MSKRVGFLIENIADPDNLRLAFWKACKGKEAKALQKSAILPTHSELTTEAVLFIL
jgi:hypothetical protein